MTKKDQKALQKFVHEVKPVIYLTFCEENKIKWLDVLYALKEDIDKNIQRLENNKKQKAMKYFIEDVIATGYNTKNDKGVELYRYLKDKYSRVILDSGSEISNIINDINRKICELNDKYPRLKQNLKAELQKFEYCDFDEIVVKWDDKNHTTCCVIKFFPAKGILVGGVVQSNY